MYLFYPLLGCCCLPISFPSIYSYLLVFFFFFFLFLVLFPPLSTMKSMATYLKACAVGLLL